MVDLSYILTLAAAGDKTFVMPSGFEANVEIHCWGAGGGGFGTSAEDTYQRTMYTQSWLATGYNGSGPFYSWYASTQTITVPAGTIPPEETYLDNFGIRRLSFRHSTWVKVGSYSGIGAQGGGGGYASTNVQIPEGSTVRLQIGQAGTAGTRLTGGVSGSDSSYTRYRGGGAGGGSGTPGSGGAGGGGGGASAVVIDDSPVCVAAGGGGAGGPGVNSRIGSQGNPGGVYPGSATDIYPVTLSYAWCQFMNDYAVWGPVNPFTTTINFPTTGIYTFAFAVDNYGNVQVDGVQVVSSSSYTSVTYGNVTVNSGNRTVRVFATNTGGPAGVAVRILKPDLSELTNSRNYTVSDGLTATSDGGTSANGWTSGGGGGGGYYGGDAGATYGDNSGNAPGGNGGQNYGVIVESGSGPTGAGKSITYYPRTLVITGLGSITWNQTIVRYQAVAGSQVTNSWQVTPGGSLVLPPGSIPPGTTLQPDGTATTPFPGFGSLGLTPVYRSYEVWTPGVRSSTEPVAYIGNSGYPGYIVMIFRRKAGLQIKNPDSSGDWVSILNSYIRTNAPRPSVTAAQKIFTNAGTSSYTVSQEVRSLTLTYLTSTGFQSQIISVIPGQTLPVTVGDFGQPSSFGDFTIPAYNKQVFRYVGNVDHLLNADVQIANASGNPLATAGYEAGQTAAAAAAGLYYNVTYEGWHGDLYSTLNFNPVPTSQLLNNFRIVPAGGGRAGAPTVPVQPTVANNYRMSIQMFDPGGGEGGYDSYFTLQQQGYFRVDFDLPIIISGWKEIQRIFVKNDNVWKAIAQKNEIDVNNYSGGGGSYGGGGGGY